MAKQQLLWTVLPFGRVEDQGGARRYRVSVVVSPRLTPQAPAQRKLKAFAEMADWPASLAKLKLSLRIGSANYPLQMISQTEPELWDKLLPPSTPVAGYKFTNMSKVNLRSFPVRNVLGFVRQHYANMALHSPADHPRLLPWSSADNDLRDMLEELGTRTRPKKGSHDETALEALPGFSRFFDREGRRRADGVIDRQVFGANGVYSARVVMPGAKGGKLPGNGKPFPLRVLPPDWNDPASSGSDAALMSQFSSAAEYSFYQADRFYRRSQRSDQQLRMRRPSFQQVPAPPEEPEYDFHRIVASYADYPGLLRQLGLVIDCLVDDRGEIDNLLQLGGGQAVGTMRLVVKAKPGAAHQAGGDQRPLTAWYADKERFVTRERSDDHQRGMLRLADAGDGWGRHDKSRETPFDVYQVDPDGTAMKTVNFTLTAQQLLSKSLNARQQDGEVTYTTGDTQPVAGLRSGGIGISRHGRAQAVAVDAASAAVKNQRINQSKAQQVVLFAEDVLRGYRVDVAPVPDLYDPGPWFGLCGRVGEYRFTQGDGLIGEVTDEGYVKGSSTSRSLESGSNPDDHYLHESLFRWSGWSLCAPHPGLTIKAESAPGSQLQNEVPSRVEDKAAKGNGVAASFRAPRGSLPKLRFGQYYRLRARIVDLAGNSLSLEEPDKLENATDAVGYWRFEPVDPPSMLHRTRVSEGESLERMVIRSNHDLGAEAYLNNPLLQEVLAARSSGDFEYHAVNERHLVPPKSSQQQCEHHGLFDPYFSDPDKIKAGYEIAAREAGTLFDPVPGSQIELVTPSEVGTVATTTSVPPALPSPGNPVGDRLTGGQYIVHREQQVIPPYLPDDAAGGVALRALPGHQIPGVSAPMTLGAGCYVVQAPDQRLVLLIEHQGHWPDAVGCRIRLQERDTSHAELPCDQSSADDGRPKWDADKRLLTLFLDKGQIVRLAYSSFVAYSHHKAFGIPNWMNNDADAAFVRGMGMAGCHWMLTPHRELTLVHATQQPVCLPEMIKLQAKRLPGEQSARLYCPLLRLHGPSTGKFEIEAEWNEWIDDINDEAPRRMSRRGQLGEVILAENHANTFPLHSAVEAQKVDDRREWRGDDHVFGDTRFRLVRYRVRATTRFREYLPPEIYDLQEQVSRVGPVALGERVLTGADTDGGAPVLLDPTGSQENTRVLASASPDDPRVLYVVPTFRWEEDLQSKTRRIVRRGNGLRVWLDRPWFSSGDGELLGVVLYRNPERFTAIPKAMQPLVTQWGMDPLWDTVIPKNRASVSDFTARVHSETLSLQEQPGQTVEVVGHRVHWDEGRGLWYCDIELSPGGSYMPFVRLALVRYQPNALNDCKVSGVALSEFTQVLPNRRAEFSLADGEINLSLRGAAPHYGPMKFPGDSEYQDISYVGGEHETGRNRVELVLQVRDPDIDSDLAWSDKQQLASSVVAPDGVEDDTPFVTRDPGRWNAVSVPIKKTLRTVQLRSGKRVKLENTVRLNPTLTEALRKRVPGPWRVSEPLIWRVKADIPSQDQPARLVLREFERYYTDRWVPEKRGNSTHKLRVIEERLVYSAFIPL